MKEIRAFKETCRFRLSAKVVGTERGRKSVFSMASVLSHILQVPKPGTCTLATAAVAGASGPRVHRPSGICLYASSGTRPMPSSALPTLPLPGPSAPTNGNWFPSHPKGSAGVLLAPPPPHEPSSLPIRFSQDNPAKFSGVAAYGDNQPTGSPGSSPSL